MIWRVHHSRIIIVCTLKYPGNGSGINEKSQDKETYNKIDY